MLLTGDKNKGEDISSDQVGKYKLEAYINDQSVPEKKQVVREPTGIQ